MSTYSIVAEVNLNVADGYAANPTVTVKQYDGDYTRQLKLTIYNEDELYEIPEDSTVVLHGTNAGGYGFRYVCTYSGSVVTAPLMRTMTTYNGETECELDIQTPSLGSSTTANFIVWVEKSAIDVTDFVESGGFQLMVDYQNAAKYYQQLSQSYAVGNTDIRDDEGTDNSEYYSIVAKNARDNVLAFVGAPYVARSSSDMIAKSTRIYVYVGSEAEYTYGHWYYYDYEEQAWLDGGVYNSNAGYLISPTVTDMIANVTYTNEKTVRTLGKTSIGDGGGALYKIVDDVPTGIEYETLANGKYAQLVQIDKVYSFDTRALMVASKNLVPGMLVRTLGDSSLNDGDGGLFYITSSTSGSTYYTLANGYYAHVLTVTDATLADSNIAADAYATGVAIANEAATRLANDTTLQNNIDTEAATRLANDTTLQTNIDTEASTRAAADTALDNAKANWGTTLADYNIANAYTKSEVDAIVSTVFEYKGTKSTYSEVEALTGQSIGDVWFVTADSSEYAWNGSTWEKLGPVIDLSPYMTAASIAGISLSSSSYTITQAQLQSALGLGSAAYVNTESSVANDANLPTGAAVTSYMTSYVPDYVANMLNVASGYKLDISFDSTAMIFKIRQTTDTVGAGYALVYYVSGSNMGRLELRNYTATSTYTTLSYTIKTA